MIENVEEKFLRYVRVDTPSSEDNFQNTPSTPCQFALANMLADELKAMGLEPEVTDKCYVYCSIPANTQTKYSIGFIAHLDVVEMPKGYGVNPVVCGDEITSDGTTVLGADDKAGVAEIMAMAEYLVNHPEIKHGKIGIAFTPDEEIGHGAAHFDVKKFGCDFAYTVDGEELGEISYETFNGACFDVCFKGVNIHPGQAKGRMVNAITCATLFTSYFPDDERPETTEGREGYYFFSSVRGHVEHCVLHGIIRDHDKNKFEERKRFVLSVAEEMKREGYNLTVDMRDQYYNCAQVIEPHFHLIDNAVAAMRAVGVEPIIFPIRGGTDGSALSFMGLPCPNICTGGGNAHGLNEHVSISAMRKVVGILLGIISAYS